ncbi:MAG: aspartate dehydrogenase [candidate division FCPU426 bacterium]
MKTLPRRPAAQAVSIGVVGCGAIGSQLARALARGAVPGARLVSLTDLNLARARSLAQTLRPRPRVLSLDEAARASDLLVEAAGMAAVKPVAAAALRERKHLLVMSVGGLLEHPELAERFRRAGRRLAFPAGALCGLDGLRAAKALGRIQSVRLVTRKPPRGLAGAPFFKTHPLRLERLKQARRIFCGSAREAVKAFPANVNVAAAVALTGIGADRTRVEIVADPGCRRNVHLLEVRGDFGRLQTVTENEPSRENPKTSALAAASALAWLRDLA